MPTLYDWIQYEYELLAANGKQSFADSFEDFRQHFFAGHYEIALNAVYDLRQGADALGETNWLGVIDYFEAASELYWRGNLAAALDRITNGLLTFQGKEHAPAWYTMELAFDIWLAMDALGYAPKVLQSMRQVRVRSLPDDLQARFDLVKAKSLAALGDVKPASEIVLSRLDVLPWPEAYLSSLRGEVLIWQRRYPEALEQLQLAVKQFTDLGMPLEACGIQLLVAQVYHEQGRYDRALAESEQVLKAAEGGVNRSQSAFTLGQMGKTHRKMAQNEQAVATSKAALSRLEGLGWLRHEADYAMTSLYASVDVGGDWANEYRQAERCVYRLLSTDLQNELEDYCNKKGISL